MKTSLHIPFFYAMLGHLMTRWHSTRNVHQLAKTLKKMALPRPTLAVSDKRLLSRVNKLPSFPLEAKWYTMWVDRLINKDSSYLVSGAIWGVQAALRASCGYMAFVQQCMVGYSCTCSTDIFLLCCHLWGNNLYAVSRARTYRISGGSFFINKLYLL